MQIKAPKKKKTSIGFYALLLTFVIASALIYVSKSKDTKDGVVQGLRSNNKVEQGVETAVDSEAVKQDDVFSKAVKPDDVDIKAVKPDDVDIKAVKPDDVDSEAVKPDDVDSEAVKPDDEAQDTSIRTPTQTPTLSPASQLLVGSVTSKQGKETHVDYRPLIPFEALMKKFNATAPVTNVIPECLEQSGVKPIPSILMSIGRSGSTVILNTLSKLTNSEPDVIWREFVGQNIFDQDYFFNLTITVEEKLASEPQHINNVGLILKQSEARKNEIPAKNNFKHGRWMMNYLCRLQRQRPNDLVGFQFKPLLYSFMRLKEARESLQLLASLASSAAAVEQEPPVVVIRSRRNTMDVFLSTMKHLGNSDLESHCAQGDEECLLKVKEEGKQTVADVEFFYNKVTTMWGQENLIDRMLVELKVPHILISYDTLYYPDQISDGEEAWNKLLQYIYPSSARVSWADVQNAIELASTRTSRKHEDIIQNWEEVYERFRGTDIEHLFRI